MDCLKVDGLDKLLSKLDALSRYDAVQEGLEEACERVEKTAKKNCPVKTGALQASITHRIEDNKGIIGSIKKYAPYVELGTGLYAVNSHGRKKLWGYEDPKTEETILTAGQHPQPYLQPALEENAEAVKNDIIKAINKKIREVCK